MSDSRPDPERLLAGLKLEASERSRGRLKIYLGYAAGVGKTYAMLEDARRTREHGKDLVIGYLEPHARPRTAALADGLETISPLEISYQGVQLREFDLAGAINRKPELILIDELAHTNAEGVPHRKRWQDVLDLLDGGIDVWTTLNVQHIESLNDIVYQVTGVKVRETVPDHVLESSHEIELIDLPPEELFARLERGEVYASEQVSTARQSFFKQGNLSALRELALRQVATRVHREVEASRELSRRAGPWATQEHLLVCVGPSPTTSRVLRTAKRMAVALNAKWTALSVDLPRLVRSSHDSMRIAEHFRLAEQLGASIVTLVGDDVVKEILAYARARNITKIVIGKTNEPMWKRLFRRSVVDQLLELSGGIDVYVIQGAQERIVAPDVGGTAKSPRTWLQYVVAVVATGVAGTIAAGLSRLRLADSEANTVLIFLAAVAFVAYRQGVGGAVCACVASVLVFDFFFVPPFYTFAVSDAQYFVTFAVMLCIGMLISTLAARLRLQIRYAGQREQRAERLYELGRELSSIYGDLFLTSATATKLKEILRLETAVYLCGECTQGSDCLLSCVAATSADLREHPVSAPAAAWACEHQQLCGAATNTLPNARGVFFPLLASQRCLGTLAISATEKVAQQLLEPDTRRLIESCAAQLALALERDQLALAAAEARLQAHAEELRNTLLSSVTHDLKTPLAAITGASSTLLVSQSVPGDVQKRLLESIVAESSRLNRLLDNLLQMSRIESGGMQTNLQWHVLEEVIGAALRRTQAVLEGREVKVHVPADVPLLRIDDVLLEQVLVNVLENAAKYTPEGTRIELSVEVAPKSVVIRIHDQGPGIPSGMEERIFDKFVRLSATPDDGRGSGLGLAICRAILVKLGGAITVHNHAQGGAEFCISLMINGNGPSNPDMKHVANIAT